MNDEIEVRPINPLGNIKSVDFIKFLGNEEFVDKLLRTKCHDDVVYEHAEFAIGCTMRNSFACLYRWLFEQTYLRNDKISFYIPHTERFVLRVSLSEILHYIKNVTPPRLAYSVESIKSISHVIKALEMFLIDKSDQFHQYYLNTFESMLRILDFDTSWTYDNSRIQKKLEAGSETFVRVIDAYDEKTKMIRMTYALSPTPEHVDAIQKLLTKYKISNVHKFDGIPENIILISLAHV